MSKRYTLTLGEKTQSTLDDLAEKTEKSKAELIREGIALTKYFEDETEQGKKVCIVDEDGEIEKEVVFP